MTNSGIEPLFPLAVGIILLLLLTGALFTTAITVAVVLTGTLYFAGGLVFGRSEAHSPLGAGIALLAPFLLTSVFIVVKFGSPFLLFPALASGGVATGVVLRRRFPGGVLPVIVGTLWVGIVVLLALFVHPF
jgi:hypothetical protein